MSLLKTILEETAKALEGSKEIDVKQAKMPLLNAQFRFYYHPIWRDFYGFDLNKAEFFSNSSDAERSLVHEASHEAAVTNDDVISNPLNAHNIEEIVDPDPILQKKGLRAFIQIIGAGKRGGLPFRRNRERLEYSLAEC